VKFTPDNFPIVMQGDLRELWVVHRNIDVRRLILEIDRARKVQKACLTMLHSAKYALEEKHYDEAAGHLDRAIDCLFNEKMRLGSQGGIPVQTPIKE
jgi:hypothetical protein